MVVQAAGSGSGAADENAAIRWWLYGLCALIFAMILVGGATRLTDSGLSITEWKPIIGIIPPLSAADWQDAFSKYQQIPEYHLVNKGMSLAAFKSIFWWEWAHRFLGRMIGFAFLLPFLFFWLTGRIERTLMPKLVAMLVLGGLQGALGWYMVASGLTERVDVSQYRLAAHLCTAIFIYGYILWVALGLRQRWETTAGQGTLVSASGLTLLIFFQIALGAFTAGIDAGLASDTWPLMNGAAVPEGLNELSPWYRNLFENPLTVQFDHRLVGYLVVLWALAHALGTVSRELDSTVRLGAGAILLAALTQMSLGVWTVVSHVHLPVALTHQGGAVVLFTLALVHLHLLVYARRGVAA